jgi:iron complex outermembrane receptor protein
MKKGFLQLLTVLALVLLTSASVFAQGTVTGTLLDKNTDEGLISASVTIKGSNKGAITDSNGAFTITEVAVGEQILVVSYIGYVTTEVAVTVVNGQTTDAGQIGLENSSIGLSEVEVIASLAKDRRTPVAVTTIKGNVIEALIGNQEFPEILRNTPSVYVTKQGGGFGDARINVRGFDQRNTAVMINGIPVNDMENGWVYWSNWAGLSDVTSTLQIQRGLGASKLAVPAVGGSINIVTNAADFKKGGAVSVGVGNNGYQKYSVVLSSGQMDNGFAITAQATSTRGATFAQGTDFEAYSYFISSSYKINDNQSISGTVLGAPQWHNQRNGASRFDNISLQTLKDQGIDFNHLYGDLDGEQFTWRKNFYHKPKAFLNHYLDINDKTSLKTSAYISIGRGGGTGPRGRLASPTTFDSFSGFGEGLNDDNGQVRFNDIVAYNQGDSITGGGFGAVDGNPGITANSNSNGNRDGFIRRASMNNHNWYGVLSTLDSKVSENFNFVAGIDARYYKGEHFRRVENLLGNTSYESFSDINNRGKLITAEAPAEFGSFGDNGYKDGTNVIAYHNDGLVGWLGAFVQGEYTTDKLSAFLSLSGSNQSFKRVDYFSYYTEETRTAISDTITSMTKDAWLTANPSQSSDWQGFLGGTVKLGANYNINETSNVFFNAGLFSRQPIFDNVFINFRNDLNEDVKNQTVTAFEAGYGFNNGKLDIDLNGYYTKWGNRQFSTTDQNAAGETLNYLFENVAQTHIGLEFEFKYNIIKELSVNGMLSVGDWTYSNDFTATGTNIDTNTPEGELTIYADGVKVGDAAQTTLSVGLTARPIKGLSVYANLYYANNLYAQYDIFDDRLLQSGLDIGERQSAIVPAYTLVDLGGSYNFDINGTNLTIRLNVNNLLNEEYISEMFTSNQDDPTTTEVDEFYTTNRGFFGFGRTWNAGVKFRF